MSRIYEALQKAESERKLERREPEPQASEPAYSATAHTVAAVAVADEEHIHTPIVTEPYVEPAYVRQTNDSSLDLSKVVSRPWALSPTQTPALLERGPAVEQFRSLRSRIFELRDISPLKTILVTSGLPQEDRPEGQPGNQPEIFAQDG